MSNLAVGPDVSATAESRSREVYARRRKELMSRMGSDAALLVVASPAVVRSNDVEYPYRADNDLVYLTGFAEPETVCLLLPGHPDGEFLLFVRPRDPGRETWTGRRAGVEGAVARFGADRGYPIAQLEQTISELVASRERLFYRFGRDSAFNDRVVGWMRHWQQLRPRSGSGPTTLVDSAELIHEMRLFKCEEELVRLRKAAEVAARGHLLAMHAARAGMYEFEIEALLDSTFRRLGAAGPAYPSIVASGENATVLHYTENNRQLQDGELLLIDAGAEYDHYCSDITRTFPIGVQSTPERRAVYDAVLRAQLAAIDAVRPGNAYDEPHHRAVEVLVEELIALGLLQTGKNEAIEKELYRSYYMHRTSHWLGMDVHDVGAYKVGSEVRKLEPGMVLTVEPGLYISPERDDVPEGYRGIGVRIEDDVVVTEGGCEVLTEAVPKTWEEISSLIHRS